MKAEYRCFHCGKDFTYDGEKIYAIWPLVLSPDSAGVLHWRWRSENENDYHFFHDACFEEIAGKIYMVKIKDEDEIQYK